MSLQKSDLATTEKNAILLINIGTPELATRKSVALYLRRLLSDHRIINMPRILKFLLINGIILPLRVGKSVKKYRKIWEKQGSPLLFHSSKQSDLLQKKLSLTHKSPVLVGFAMRHSHPAVNSVIQEFMQQNVTRLIIIPLFPQYSFSTSASVFDNVHQTLLKLAYQPKLISINSFYNHPAYISALAENIYTNWKHNGRGEKLLISFHSLPLKNIRNGDPYLLQCQKSAELLTNKLGLTHNQWQISFQSRFGKNKWLSPATADILVELGNQKLKQLDVICPGFIADCLETLEEIAITGKKQFQCAGGENFNYIPCLNSSSAWIDALHQIVNEHLAEPI